MPDAQSKADKASNNGFKKTDAPHRKALIHDVGKKRNRSLNAQTLLHDGDERLLTYLRY
ncbi:MAG: hypothetical protein LBH04_05090 [Tannerellaceae bacterium]|jgi:hypothetical protein|nr:hypothetical protein [Tannerellaceae bacterium]